jgi:hypothetical protein
LVAFALLRSQKPAPTSTLPAEHASEEATEAAPDLRPTPPDHARQSSKNSGTAGSPPADAATPDSGADVLRKAESCLRPDLADANTLPADLAPIWRCLQSLDWSRVAPVDLATWLCSAQCSLRQASLVGGAALYARSPNDALAFLAQYEPTCANFRESGLQIMAIEAIARVDSAWVAELERNMTPDALFTGSSSTQGILLAEYFIRRGNVAIAAMLEDGGRGLLGGSDKEMARSAAMSLFLHSTRQWSDTRAGDAWSYAESLLYSPTTPAVAGNVLAAFLPSRQTWPQGDSTPALKTLSSALDDPRFAATAAIVLFAQHAPEGPDGCDKRLWAEIYAKVLAIAAKNQWEPPPKK